MEQPTKQRLPHTKSGHTWAKYNAGSLVEHLSKRVREAFPGESMDIAVYLCWPHGTQGAGDVCGARQVKITFGEE